MADCVMAASTVSGKFTSMLACGLSVAVGVAVLTAQSRRPGAGEKSAYGFSGPYTHENLTIFLIHGDDALKQKIFLTLPEALQQKKIVIHETRSVNELSMEN